MKKAFTLAEVLITLGIIGIVAAMTIPTLITNYQKQQTVNRLKKIYSVISQAIVTSQSENGDFSEWGLNDNISIDLGTYRTRLSNIVKNNIIPYLKVGEDCAYSSSCFHRSTISRPDGQVYPYGGSEYIIYLVDGTKILFWLDNNGKIIMNMGITVDINGDTKPNTYGRDIFIFYFDSNTKALNMWGVGDDRNKLISECKTGGAYCGGLIQHDEWQIKDDYPW